MTKSIFKKIITFVFLLLLLSGVSFAAIECDSPLAGSGAPGFTQMICPIYRIISVLLIGGGIVLGVFIAYGAIKLSISLGDPKGFEGGKKTWTFALIGFFIVVGSITILTIVGGMITGNDSAFNLTALKDVFERGLCGLLQDFMIQDDGCSVE